MNRIAPASSLYHHVAAQVPLRGKDVLEVSCGHGGGAAYVARTFQPRRYTALDLNPAAIRFCQEHHRREGLIFRQGDAEHLPFEDGTFDAVINVEASHCYPDFPRFLAEVARVLKPGGHFLYADFRFADGLAEWEEALASCPMQIEHMRTINAEVLRGMDRNSARSLELIGRHLPKFLHGLGRDFAGVQGFADLQCAGERGIDLSVVLFGEGGKKLKLQALQDPRSRENFKRQTSNGCARLEFEVWSFSCACEQLGFGCSASSRRRLREFKHAALCRGAATRKFTRCANVGGC